MDLSVMIVRIIYGIVYGMVGGGLFGFAAGYMLAARAIETKPAGSQTDDSLNEGRGLKSAAFDRPDKDSFPEI